MAYLNWKKSFIKAADNLHQREAQKKPHVRHAVFF